MFAVAAHNQELGSLLFSLLADDRSQKSASTGKSVNEFFWGHNAIEIMCLAASGGVWSACTCRPAFMMLLMMM